MIDKVGYTRPTTSTSRTGATRKTDSVAGVQFAEALAKAEGVGGVSGVDHVGSIGAIGSTMGLLGLQEVNEEDVKKRRAVKKGRLTLEALSNLRDALLMGSLPLSTLKNLEKLVEEERGTTTDPILNSILDEIELRAAVELAKLEMSGVFRS